MLRFLIVEDDPSAAQLLESHVREFLSGCGREAEIEVMPSAFDLLEFDRKYDLIFLDIDLPGISGMDAAAQLREHDRETIIIFVTSLAKYAVKGYEVEALDFVVKPVSYEAIAMRLRRAFRVLDARPVDNICLTTRAGIKVFPASSLMYVEVNGHNVVYHLSDGEPVHTRGTLKGVVESLLLPQFIQISSGCIVNADYVRSIEGPELVTADGSRLVISRPKRKGALEAFARYYGGTR